MKRLSSVFAIGFLCMNLGWAIPSLQLDIAGGTYDSASQTIIAPANPFSLYSLVDPSTLSAGGTFYLSAAIVPKTSDGSFGSFTVNGVTYSSANMVYGNPPSLTLENSGELPSHGIYDTYYAEIAFQFDPNNKALSYNTATTPGGFTSSDSGSLLYSAFNVDMSGLLNTTTVHFDLYNVKLDRKGNLVVDQFAPFSHDAQGASFQVPDSSSTMVLLGIGMIVLEGFRRRISAR